MDPAALYFFAQAYNPQAIIINAPAINGTQPPTASGAKIDSFEIPRDWTVGYLIEEGVDRVTSSGGLAISFDGFSTSTWPYTYNYYSSTDTRGITIFLRSNTDVYCYRYVFRGTSKWFEFLSSCKAPLTDNKIYFRRTASYTFPTTYIAYGFFS